MYNPAKNFFGLNLFDPNTSKNHLIGVIPERGRTKHHFFHPTKKKAKKKSFFCAQIFRCSLPEKKTFRFIHFSKGKLWITNFQYFPPILPVKLKICGSNFRKKKFVCQILGQKRCTIHQTQPLQLASKKISSNFLKKVSLWLTEHHPHQASVVTRMNLFSNATASINFKRAKQKGTTAGS